MSDIVQIAFFLLIGLTLGVASRRIPRAGIPENLADGLTTVVIFVSLPALILLRVPSMQLSSALLVPVLMPWIMIAVSVAMVFQAAKLLRWSDSVRNLLLMLVPLG